MADILCLKGDNSLSAFRLQRLQARLTAAVSDIESVAADYWHVVAQKRALSADERAKLAQLLEEQGDGLAENMYRMVGDWMRGTQVRLPDQPVAAGERAFGSHRLRLLALTGHSGADLAVFDEKTGVLFAGDLLFYQRALTTPNTPGLAVWLQDLQRLEALPWKVLVPGHGPLATDRAPFAQMVDYLGWLDKVMRESAAQGLDMTEVIATPIPQRFAGIALSQYELIRSVSHLYPQYERQVLKRVDR